MFVDAILVQRRLTAILGTGTQRSRSLAMLPLRGKKNSKGLHTLRNVKFDTLHLQQVHMPYLDLKSYILAKLEVL